MAGGVAASGFQVLSVMGNNASLIEETRWHVIGILAKVQRRKCCRGKRCAGPHALRSGERLLQTHEITDYDLSSITTKKRTVDSAFL